MIHIVSLHRSFAMRCENASVLHDDKLIPCPTVDQAYEFYLATLAARPLRVEV